MPDSSTAHGSYGLRLRGLASREYLASIPGDLGWPAVEVRQVLGACPVGSDRVNEAMADVRILDGDRVLIDRRASTATHVAAQQRLDGRIVHPFLTAVGTVFAWWLGREAFHGGGFIAGGGAWGVLGERAAGKSSLLAALSLRGWTVVSDDLLVVANRTAFAGPRCIDLRPDVNAALGLEVQTESVRGGQRFRLSHAPVEPETPMRGWIFPTWGRSLNLRPLPPSERLALLAGHRCAPSVTRSGLMDLVRLPAWQLVRPRSWRLLEAAVERLLAVTDT